MGHFSKFSAPSAPKSGSLIDFTHPPPFRPVTPPCLIPDLKIKLFFLKRSLWCRSGFFLMSFRRKIVKRSPLRKILVTDGKCEGGRKVVKNLCVDKVSRLFSSQKKVQLCLIRPFKQYFDKYPPQSRHVCRVSPTTFLGVVVFGLKVGHF